VQRKFAAPCHKILFQEVEYHYDNILEKLNLQTRHLDALVSKMSLVALNIAPLSWKQSAFVFLQWTYSYVTLPRSVAPSATVLQLDAYLLQIKFVNLQLFLVSGVLVWKVLANPLFFVSCFSFVCLFCPVLFYCCSLYSCWLCNWPLAVSSARNSIKNYYCYYYYYYYLELYVLRKGTYHLDAQFLVELYLDFKLCPSVLEIVALRVPARYIRDFTLFNVCSSNKIVPLLDALQLLMLLEETLMHLEPKLFSLNYIL
jgi:hypothetical protein